MQAAVDVLADLKKRRKKGYSAGMYIVYDYAL
jgi:hypothetical protein